MLYLHNQLVTVLYQKQLWSSNPFFLLSSVHFDTTPVISWRARHAPLTKVLHLLFSERVLSLSPSSMTFRDSGLQVKDQHALLPILYFCIVQHLLLLCYGSLAYFKCISCALVLTLAPLMVLLAFLTLSATLISLHAFLDLFTTLMVVLAFLTTNVFLLLTDLFFQFRMITYPLSNFFCPICLLLEDPSLEIEKKFLIG